jgi:hypothetical protein
VVQARGVIQPRVGVTLAHVVRRCRIPWLQCASLSEMPGMVVVDLCLFFFQVLS